MEGYITVAQLAALRRTSTQAISNDIRRGKYAGATIKQGGRRYIAVSVLSETELHQLQTGVTNSLKQVETEPAPETVANEQLLHEIETLKQTVLKQNETIETVVTNSLKQVETLNETLKQQAETIERQSKAIEELTTALQSVTHTMESNNALHAGMVKLIQDNTPEPVDADQKQGTEPVEAAQTSDTAPESSVTAENTADETTTETVETGSSAVETPKKRRFWRFWKK